jgi:hypothetical protein
LILNEGPGVSARRPWATSNPRDTREMFL